MFSDVFINISVKKTVNRVKLMNDKRMISKLNTIVSSRMRKIVAIKECDRNRKV